MENKQAELERKKAAMFLREFLMENAPTTMDGRAYNPQTNDWQGPVQGMPMRPIVIPQGQQPPMPMNDLQKAESIMPDFFDDEFMNYAKFQEMLRSGGV